MQISLEGKRAFVTAGGDGMGRTTAITMHELGAEVFTCDIDPRGLATLPDGITTWECDVSDSSALNAIFDEILPGGLDIMINNAGVGGNGAVEETSAKRYLDVMNIDLCGATRCIQAALPGMRARGSGTIVNITSVAGRLAAVAQAPYVAAKWALEGVSEQLALEVAGFGVRVAIVEPGITQSSIFGKNVDMPNETGAYGPANERMLQMYAAGAANATPAVEVGEVIRHAIETNDPKLRYQVSWGGAEMVAGRAAMSDEDWVMLGTIESLDEYVAAFNDAFGIDIGL